MAKDIRNLSPTGSGNQGSRLAQELQQSGSSSQATMSPQEVPTPEKAREIQPPDKLTSEALRNAREALLNEVRELERRKAELEASGLSTEVSTGGAIKTFDVSLPHAGTRRVRVTVHPGMDAIVWDLAVKEFNRIMGIISTTHQYKVDEVVEDRKLVEV